MKNSATFIGTVQDVSGTSVRIVLTNESIAGFTYVNGQGYRIGQIGSFVKIPIGYTELFAIVTTIGASAVPENISEKQPYGNRWMTIQLIGEGQNEGRFERGISQYPTIDDEVHLVSESDLSSIYGRRREKFFVKVGHIAGADSIPALVDINKLITRHSAVVGTTGSGKSTTVAGLLTSLSNPVDYPSSRIIIFDIHGEYGKALKDRANIFKINPDKGEKQLCLPYWALSYDELISIAFGSLTDGDKANIAEKVIALKRKSHKNNPYLGIDVNTLSVDSSIPFSIHRLWLYLHRLVYSTHFKSEGGSAGQKFENIEEEFVFGNSSEAFTLDEDGNAKDIGDALNVRPPSYQGLSSKIILASNTPNIRRPLDGLASKLRDVRYDFLFNPGDWKPDLEGKPKQDLDILFKEWIGSEKQISIFDLSGIPSNILNDIIGIFLRILYDSVFWAKNLGQGGRQRPLLLVMEEAHNYLNDNFSGLASSIVQKIVKEGRKYGIGAMIVSQRPSEINQTILSQCGTFFALRLANATDRGHINGVISDNLEGLTKMLPILKTGEAIILGEAVQLPMRAYIDAPPKDRRPDSQDPVVYYQGLQDDNPSPGGWGDPMEVNPKFDDFLHVNRSQNPKFVVELNKQKKK